jgi:hypothetical protein
VWLWPYTEKLRVARAEVDQLCADRAGHATIQAQVDDFTAKMARVRELIAAIEKVRDGRRLPEIEVDRRPPLREAPVRPKTT